jgi:hypothetical protein
MERSSASSVPACTEVSSTPARHTEIEGARAEWLGFGVHISFVRSITMDKWSEEQLKKMKASSVLCD